MYKLNFKQTRSQSSIINFYNEKEYLRKNCKIRLTFARIIKKEQTKKGKKKKKKKKQWIKMIW